MHAQPLSIPTLDAAPVLSAAEKAAIVHAYNSAAYARRLRAEWEARCMQARRDGDATPRVGTPPGVPA